MRLFSEAPVGNTSIGREANAGDAGSEAGVNDIRNPLVCSAYELWERLRGARSFPQRCEFTPRILRTYMRNLALIRVLPGGREFEFRVVGDALVQAQGGAMQGLTTKQLDIVLPGYGTVLGAIYRRVYKEPEALCFRGRYERQADRRVFWHESLVLPLGPDGGPIDNILVVGVYGHSYEDLLKT